MGLATRFDPIEEISLVTLDHDLNERDNKREAAKIARDGITEHQKALEKLLGQKPPYTVTVDGRKNVPLESVKLNGGEIVAEFDLSNGAVSWIMQELRDRSPVGPPEGGHYRDSHTLLADGAEIAATANIPAAKQYIFFNRVPYARKIEIGHTRSGRAFVIQVPNRIYFNVARDARAKFGDAVSISYITHEDSPAILVRQQARD